MDLNKQIKVWEKQFNWSRIIREIEKLSPEDRTPDLKVELAAAYINKTKGLWKHRKSLQKAVRILAGVDYKDRNDPYWYFSMGNAFYNLDQWTLACSYFNQYLDKMPLNLRQAAKMLSMNAERNILKPQFKQPFASRVKQAWEEFEKVEAGFREKLSKRNDYWPISEQLNDIFEPAVQDANLCLEYGEDCLEIYFLGGEDNILKLFELQYLIDHMPEKFKKNWRFTIGVPVDNPQDKETEDNLPDPPNLLFEFEGEKDGVFSLLTSQADSLKSKEERNEEYDEDDEWEAIEFAEDWMHDVLGRVATEKYFDVDGVIVDEKGKKLIPIGQLSEFLLEKGINVYDSSRKILDKRTEYTREPSSSSAQREYREDIEWGWTKCAKFLHDYEDGISENAVSLEADGSAVGCFFYRTDNIKGPDREKQLADFREKLVKTLTERAGADAFEVIGEAHGTNFDYVDILGWDIQKVLLVAFDFFKTTDVPFSGYHPLRKRCGSVRLTGENKWIPYRTQDKPNKLIDPREKESSSESEEKELYPPFEEPDDDEEINPLLRSFWKPKDDTFH